MVGPGAVYNNLILALKPQASSVYCSLISVLQLWENTVTATCALDENNNLSVQQLHLSQLPAL